MKPARTRLILFAAFLALLNLPAAAGAGDHPMFDKGSFTLHSYAAYAVSRGNEEDIGSVVIGGAYYLQDRLAIGIEASGVTVEGQDDDNYGGGLGLLLRYHVIEARQFTIFLDISGGGHETSHDVPTGGTHFNFTARGGAGITVPLNDDCEIIGGARFLHLSNGDMHGTDENPGFNGWEGYIGLIWKL